MQRDEDIIYEASGPKIPVAELDARIARLNKAYQNARQANINQFTKNAWGQLTSTDHASIALTKQVINKIWDESEEILAILLGNKLYDNAYFLTKTKLDVLIGRIDVGEGNFNKAIKKFNAIIKNLTSLQKQKGFAFAHDAQFMQEVGFIFPMAHQILKDQGLDRTDASLTLNANARELTKTWPNNIYKLQNIYNYWFTPKRAGGLLIHDIKPSDKVEFMNVVRGVIADINEKLAHDPTDATLALNFARANMLAYAFELITNPLSLHKNHIKTPLAKIKPDKLTRRVIFCQELFMAHIDSGIKQLLKANPGSLHENAESIFYLAPVINEFRYAVKELLDLHKQLNEAKTSDELSRYVILAGLALVDSGTDTHEVSHSFQLNTCTPLLKLCGQLNMAPDAFQMQKNKNQEYRELFIESEEQTRVAKSLLADETTKFLLELDEKEKQQLKSVELHLQRNKAEAENKKTKSPVKSNSKTLHCYNRAQYFSRNQRHHEAIEMYKIAYDDAVVENDAILKLAAMDGQLIMSGRTLSKKIKTLCSTLNAHIRDPKSPSPEQKDKLISLEREVANELQRISKLNVQYNALTAQSGLSGNKEINEGIAVSKHLISKLLHQINSDSDEVNGLFDALNGKFAAQRAELIYRLGRRATRTIKNQYFTKEEIDKIGLEIFVEIGEEKKRKGMPLSRTAQIKNQIEKLSKDFKSASKSTAVLLQHYQTKKDSPTVSSKEHEAFNFVPDEAWMVGGNVIAQLSNDNSNKKFNAHDVDFVVPAKYEQELIKKGFRHSEYVPFLYQKNPASREDNLVLRDRTPHIDVSVAKADSPDWLSEDAKTRDFTICAVYRNKSGKTEDPLGTGIDDIANKRLRMIGDSVVRLRDDPVRALRAMRYIIAGYEPDKALIDALKSLELPSAHHQQHLLAVARKHLLHLDHKQYVTLLHEYGLLEKLFGIPCKTNIDLAWWKLEKLLNIQKPSKANHSTLFARTDENYKGLPKEKNRALQAVI